MPSLDKPSQTSPTTPTPESGSPSASKTGRPGRRLVLGSGIAALIGGGIWAASSNQDNGTKATPPSEPKPSLLEDRPEDDPGIDVGIVYAAMLRIGRDESMTRWSLPVANFGDRALNQNAQAAPQGVIVRDASYVAVTNGSVTRFAALLAYSLPSSELDYLRQNAKGFAAKVTGRAQLSRYFSGAQLFDEETLDPASYNSGAATGGYSASRMSLANAADVASIQIEATFAMYSASPVSQPEDATDYVVLPQRFSTGSYAIEDILKMPSETYSGAELSPYWDKAGGAKGSLSTFDFGL